MNTDIPFTGFPKMARLSRECIVTEKIDGTNAQIRITEDGGFYVGSRTRWITPENDNFGFDNFGFAAWAYAHKDELMALGVGSHFGEWWGSGIQRKYGQTKKHFSLFNVSRWLDDSFRPECCRVVPILYQGLFDTAAIDNCLARLNRDGSYAAPGFYNPEGIVVYHVAAGVCLKKTLGNDGHKGA